MTPEERIKNLATALGRMTGLLRAVLPGVRWGKLYGIKRETVKREMQETLQEAGIKP